MESTYDSVKNHEVFQAVLDRLIINQFCNDYSLTNHYQGIKENDLAKAGWLASILANSGDTRHQFLAASFAKLLYLQNINDEKKSQLAYTILSRTGNLVATNHLTTVFNVNSGDSVKTFKNSFGTALDIELGTKRNLNSIKFEDGVHFVTDFQNELWSALNSYDHVAISAPTSAGKSFFVQHFILSLFDLKEEFKVIYIVPSRALISQTSDDFKVLLSKHDVSIKTAFIDSEDSTLPSKQGTLKKVIYCLTPERCLKLLQQGWKKAFRPDLIFIDEIQNVETNDNRAVLLEYILGEFNKLWIGAKIIFAGPFISNGKELYKKLLNIPAEEISTYLPPVYQLRLTLQVRENNDLVVLIHLRGGKVHEIELKDRIEVSSSSNKSMLAPIVEIFGKPDGNLIYAAKTDWCVSYAMEFIKTIKSKKGTPRPEDIPPQVKDLIDLLKDDIHPDYALIYCLKYKVAFHHGKLPDIVKNEIEYLFKKGFIEYLFCTSTLLQGVNLPAPRMFIISATKESQELSQFEFGNLIGRAGRINRSMVGTIFCLEKDWKNKPWSNAYYNSEYTRSVVPTSDKVLKGATSEIMSALNREPKFLKHTGDEYTINLIKQKFLEDPQSAVYYLSAKGVDSGKEGSVISSIEAKLKNVKISTEVARLNPMIDPILQDQLYLQIITDGVESWVLYDEDTGNQNFNRFMTRDSVDKLPYESKPMYYQLESIAERIDKIFAMWKEAFTKKSTVTSVRQMIFHAMNWVNGLSLYQLIQKELTFEEQNLVGLTREKRILKINDHINKIINVNSIVVTFILVKYFKLLSDLLDSMMTDDQREKFKRTLLIPTMLELGSRKVDVIIMISVGIPRSIAIKVSPFVPDSFKTNPVEWLSQIIDIKDLPLKSFYWKYLFRKGYLPSLRLQKAEEREV